MNSCNDGSNKLNVGYLHKHGLGVPQSYHEAMAWGSGQAQHPVALQGFPGTLICQSSVKACQSFGSL
jgi:hypothetical protein